MSLLYIIFGIVILVITLVLIIPLKIKINFNMKSENKNDEEDLKTVNKIEIYILRFIKIKTIYVNKKEKTNQNNMINNNTKNVISDISKAVENYIKYEKKDSTVISKNDIAKLKKGLKFEEFYLNLGFNLKNYILNAYAIVILNALINMYFSKNADHFDLQKTQYKTYISNKVIDLRFYSIINFKLVNNIIIILKLVLKLRKGGK